MPPKAHEVLRRLPSGRWQLRYMQPTGTYASAGTFDSKTEGPATTTARCWPRSWPARPPA